MSTEEHQDPEEEMRFSAQEFGALMNLMMVSDPYPNASVEETRLKDMLNEEARVRGYDDWIDAYHAFGYGDD